MICHNLWKEKTMFGDAENTPSSDVGPNPIQDKFGHPRSLNRSGVSRMVRDSDMFLSLFSCGWKRDAFEVGVVGDRHTGYVPLCWEMKTYITVIPSMYCMLWPAYRPPQADGVALIDLEQFFNNNLRHAYRRKLWRVSLESQQEDMGNFLDLLLRSNSFVWLSSCQVSLELPNPWAVCNQSPDHLHFPVAGWHSVTIKTPHKLWE